MDALQTIIIWVLAVCGGISTICAAGLWVIKVVKLVKKPSDDIRDKFKRVDELLNSDNKRLKDLEEAIGELLKVQPMILRSEYVILQHMRTNNSTGEIAKQEEAINDYLFNR